MGLLGRILVVVACAGLVACSPFGIRSEHRSSNIYTLDEIGKISRAEKPQCGAITVDVLGSAPGFGSARMIYSRRAHALESFAYHKWADTPANMLQALLVRALEKGGRFSSVLGRSASGRVRLDAELLELVQHFTGEESTAVLQVRFHLVVDNEVVASKVFAEKQSAGSGPESGVDAANRAAAKLTEALIPWLDETLAKTKVCQP